MAPGEPPKSIRDFAVWVGPVAAAACCAVTTWFVYRPSTGLQLLSMGACPLAFVLALGAPIAVARYRWLAGLVLVIGSPFLGAGLGHALRRADFEARARPRYEQFIDRIERGEVQLDEASVLEVPPELEDIAYGVHASRDDSGRLCVVFFWGGGFPVSHSVFVHGAPGSCGREREIFHLSEIGPQWFAGSD